MRTVNWVTVLVIVYAGLVCAFLKPEVTPQTTVFRESGVEVISTQGSYQLPGTVNVKPMTHKTILLQQVR